MYIGDVMGEVGVEVVEQLLPKLRSKYSVDVVLAQAENTTQGRGISVADFRRLQSIGIDACTGGNWTLYRDEIHPLLNDENEPIVRPANYLDGTPGLLYKAIQPNGLTILFISLLGHIVGKDADKPVNNPLQVVDKILKTENSNEFDAVVVNLHGDYSSEKVVIGNYLDGRVTAVIGDHWHVPTADAQVLPGGTAHITDVGMCGALDASLGVSYESVIPRWRDNKQTRNMLETKGRRQFNAVIVDTNEHGRADSIEQIRLIQDNSGNWL